MTGKKRRTQPERSAATRKALLEAAVKCLHEHGYGATTTIMIAEAAGVSRGAMLHQFPTKADLMAFVLEADFEEEVGLYRKLLAGIDAPRDRLIAYPPAVWRVLSRPLAIAVLEILQGSRSDYALREKLAPVKARIDARTRDLLKEEFPRGVSIPLLQLIIGAARGLSITHVLAPEGENATEAIGMLQRLLRAGVETGVLSRPESESATAAPPEPSPNRAGAP